MPLVVSYEITSGIRVTYFPDVADVISLFGTLN